MHNATIQLPAFGSKRELGIGARYYGVTAMSISVTKNMLETDSPISLVIARSFIATKAKMVDECSMNRELETFGC